MDDILRGLIISLVTSPLTVLLTIIVHETGHLLGGLVTGYSFKSFSILGLTLYRTDSGMMIRRFRRMPSGQCIMFNMREMSQNPTLLIAGGCIINLAAAAVCLVLMFFSKPMLMPLWGIAGGMNLVLGLLNLFGGSATSDGKTLKETRDKKNAEAYNGLMCVMAHAEDGRSFGEIPDKLFKAGSDGSTLTEELGYYRYCAGLTKLETRRDLIEYIRKTGLEKMVCEKDDLFGPDYLTEQLIAETVGNDLRFPKSSIEPDMNEKSPRMCLLRALKGDRKAVEIMVGEKGHSLFSGEWETALITYEALKNLTR